MQNKVGVIYRWDVYKPPPEKGVAHNWMLQYTNTFGGTETQFIWQCSVCKLEAETYAPDNVGSHGAKFFTPLRKNDCDVEMIRYITES